MTSFAISQTLSELRLNCEDSNFPHAIEFVDNIFEFLNKAVFIPESLDYSEEAIESILVHIIPLAVYNDERFLNSLNFLIHFTLTMLTSFTPRFSLRILPRIAQEVQMPVVYRYITVYYANLISNLSSKEQKELMDKLWTMIFNSPPAVLSHIPDSIYILFLNNKTEEEITSLVLLLTNAPENIHKVDLLISKNPQNIVPLIFSKAPLKFVKDLLKNSKIIFNYKFDIISFIARLADTIIEDQYASLSDSMSMLKKLLPIVDEVAHSALLPIITNIIRKLTSEKEFPAKPDFLGFLVACEKRGLVKFDEISSLFVELPPGNCLKYHLLLFQNHFNDEGMKEKVLYVMDLITMEKDERNIKTLIKCLIFFYENNNSKYNELSEEYKKRLQIIYTKIFMSLHQLSETTKLSLIQLIALKGDSKKLSSIVYDLIKGNHSKEYNNKLKNAIDTLNVWIDSSKLDWFSEFSYQNFLFIKNVELSFINEFLCLQLIEPKDLSIVTDIFCQQPEKSGPLIFKQLCTLLKVSCDYLGFEDRWILPKRYIVMEFSDELWFSEGTIRNLMRNLKYSFDYSNFGANFLRPIVRTIIATKDYTNGYLTSSVINFLLIAARYLVRIIPEDSCNLFVCMIEAHNSKLYPYSETLEKKYDLQINIFVDWFNDEQYNYGASKEFVRAYLASRGPSKAGAVMKIHDYIENAIAKDYQLAEEFQEFIDQPLPLMPTFSAFTAEKHKEWAQECREKIPEIDWITDTVNTKNSNENNQEKPNENNCSVEQSFVFDADVKIKEGPSIHKFEPNTQYGLISFLWHSNQKIPDDQVEEINSFVLEHAKEDIRLTCGYLSYAITHNLEIDVQKWINLIELSHENKLSLFAAALLLQYAASKQINDQEIDGFANNCLFLIGIGYGAVNILPYFNNPTTIGIFEWYLLRSIIGLHLDQYQLYSPIRIVGEFHDSTKDVQSILNEMLRCLEAYPGTVTYNDFAGTFSDIFLSDRSKMKCNYFLPSNFIPHQRFLSFIDLNELQNPISLGTETFQSIFAVIRKNAGIFIPSSLIHLVINFLISSSQASELFLVIALRGLVKQDLIWNIMINAKTYYDVNAEFSSFMNFKPPSYVRSFFRNYIKQKRCDISTYEYMKERIDVILNNLDELYPVFPEFVYTGLSKAGMKSWKSHTSYVCYLTQAEKLNPANIEIMNKQKYKSPDFKVDAMTPITKIRIGKISMKSIMKANIEMLEPNNEAVELFKPICNLSEEEIISTKAWKDSKSAKFDFAKQLLKASIDERAHLYITDEAFKTVSEHLNIVDIASIVTEKNFLKNSKFSAVVLLFRKLEKFLKAAHLDELVEKFDKLHKDHNLFDNDKLNELFADINNEETIYEPLRYTSD